MENLLTRHRNLSVLAVVLFVQVFGLAVQVKRSNDPQQTRLIRYWAVVAITPFEQAIVHARDGVYGVWHNYLYLRGVRQENRDLKAQIEQLRLEQVRLSQDASQARRLQALLGFKEQSILATLPAQVVGSSGSEQSRSLYLDKGEREGLRKDMAVITADGVVGKFPRLETGEDFSYTLTEMPDVDSGDYYLTIGKEGQRGPWVPVSQPVSFHLDARIIQVDAE